MVGEIGGHTKHYEEYRVIFRKLESYIKSAVEVSSYKIR